MLPNVLMLLDYAAGPTDAPDPTPGADVLKGGYLLLGNGCLLLPLLVAVLGVW